MGLSSSQDEYERQGDEAIGGIGNTHKIMDNILCANSTAPEHLRTVLKVLNQCQRHRITLSPEKFHFCQPMVKYTGYILSAEGTGMDPEKVSAITDFPSLTNITEL